MLNQHNRKVPPAPKVSLEKLSIQTPKVNGPFFATVHLNNEEVYRSSEIVPHKKRDYFDIPMGIDVEGDCNVLLCAKRMGSEVRALLSCNLLGLSLKFVTFGLILASIMTNRASSSPNQLSTLPTKIKRTK